MLVTMASSFHRNAASDDPVMELLKLFGLKHDPAPQRLAPPQTVLERDFQWDSHGPAPNDDCSTHAQMGRPEGAQGPGNVLDQLAGLPCFHPFAHHGGDYFHDGGRLARKTRRHILPPNEFLGSVRRPPALKKEASNQHGQLRGEPEEGVWRQRIAHRVERCTQSCAGLLPVAGLQPLFDRPQPLIGFLDSGIEDSTAGAHGISLTRFMLALRRSAHLDPRQRGASARCHS